jgi:hypothetical protein
MVPAAPTPVHSAYAVPNGTDLSENASKAKLKIIADSIPIVGQNLVKPSDGASMLRGGEARVEINRWDENAVKLGR